MMSNKPNRQFFLICLSIFFLIDTSVFSQQTNCTLNRDYLWGFDNYFNNKDQSLQTFIKPYRSADMNLITDAAFFFLRSSRKRQLEEKDKKYKNLLEVAPLLEAKIGYESGSSSRLFNDLAIGGNLVLKLGTKFGFNLKAYGGQATFSSYTDSVIKQTRMIPGIGYAYLSKYDSLNPQYSYQYFSGYASFSPNNIFNFQLGRDKHFWGDGYRSLFLSDVAAPYPFLKITTNIWHLTYVNLYAILKDATNSSGFKKDWTNKYATFHYLGWNATKRINIGLFESVVWQGKDSSRYRGYDINYLNPVLFFRPTEYSLGSSDNSFIGFSFKLKLFTKQQLYGQLLLDEFLFSEVKAHNGWWGNKQAFQTGFKSFDLFKVKKLNFQTEFNYVRPYTYSHGSVQQNYGHMNQPLAHPLGANFMESASFINYTYKRFFLEAKCVYAIYGGDSSTSDYGKNIFISYANRPNEYGNYTGQGYQSQLVTASLRVAYILDTRMHLKVELGFADRVLTTSYATAHTPYIFFGIKTDLCNLYDDF